MSTTKKQPDEKESRTVIEILTSKASPSGFVRGRVRGDAFSQLLKKLRVTGSSKNAVAMLVTNIGLFDEITVPAGCATLDQNFLTKKGDWRLILFSGDERLMTATSCPFTRDSDGIDPDEPENQEYVSPIYILAVEHLAKINTRFNGGFINISAVGDKFEFSQSSVDRFNVRGARQNVKPTLLCVNCVHETPMPVLDLIKRIWESCDDELTLPYRFTTNGNGGGSGFGFGKSSSGDSELMWFKYISFHCGNKWLGDGVLEGDTNEQGAASFCTQFNAIRSEMFNEGDVDVSDGSSAKRRKHMTTEEWEAEEEKRLHARLAVLNEENCEEEEEEGASEIGALVDECARKIQRVAATEDRPFIEALPIWFSALWSLEQNSTKVAEFHNSGTSPIIASCRAEIILPGSTVKAINDLCATGNVASTYFVPSKNRDYKGISMLVVMSHSASLELGVTSVTIVTPFTRPA
jgi:hypothetical protein